MPAPDAADVAGRRYAAWFHALDAWTEYWDLYQPASRGRYYFGDGAQEPGLLSRFLPRERTPPVFTAWKRMALKAAPRADFLQTLAEPAVAEAIGEVDALLARLFAAHFGSAQPPATRADYLEGLHRFAINTLPPAPERDARIAADDPRKPTAGRHTLEGDMMWFGWALHAEAALALPPPAFEREPDARARQRLMLAGVACGCAAQFAWRGHRRTRPEYRPDAATAAHLRTRGLAWAGDAEAAAAEVHALFRIREWGHDDDDDGA